MSFSSLGQSRFSMRYVVSTAVSRTVCVFMPTIFSARSRASAETVLCETVNLRCGRSNSRRWTPGIPSSVRRTKASSLRQSMLLTWKTVVSVLVFSWAQLAGWLLPPEQPHELDGSLFIVGSRLGGFSQSCHDWKTSSWYRVKSLEIKHAADRKIS
jgi:hypothetical protein